MSNPSIPTTQTVQVDGDRRIPATARRIVRPERHGNFRWADHRRVVADRVSVEEVTKTVSGTLANFETKDIVEATGGSIRAAENVKQGLNAMSLTSFINACRAIPELRAVAMQMMGCEAETDPEFMRGLHHLINAYVRRDA